MTQLEIATRILCSGKADNPTLAYKLAGELMELDKDTYKVLGGVNFKVSKDSDEVLNDDELEALKERTANRTQELINLGFEWNEEHQSFERGVDMIIPEAIENFNSEDWERTIAGSESEDHKDISEYSILEVKEGESYPRDNEIWQPDFFKGKDYIEFEMDKSVLRLFKLDDRVKVEDDLQVTKKAEPGYIMASSDNEEYQLGITIYKK